MNLFKNFFTRKTYVRVSLDDLILLGRPCYNCARSIHLITTDLIFRHFYPHQYENKSTSKEQWDHFYNYFYFVTLPLLNQLRDLFDKYLDLKRETNKPVHFKRTKLIAGIHFAYCLLKEKPRLYAPVDVFQNCEDAIAPLIDKVESMNTHFEVEDAFELDKLGQPFTSCARYILSDHLISRKYREMVTETFALENTNELREGKNMIFKY